MIIYQPVASQTYPNGLNYLAVELAGALVVPKCTLLSSCTDADSAHLLLQTASALVAFEVYAKEAGEEIFESILKLGVSLEAKRKEQSAVMPKDIFIYILASDFSSELLNRIPSSLVGVRLFKWCFLRSGAQEALMVHETEQGIGQDKIAIDSIRRIPLGDDLQRSSFHQAMSTREFIALNRLGIELRNQRS